MASVDLELCYLTATEAIDQFKAKKLSPIELMKAVLARCETVNPKLNVLTYTFAERALEHAKASEARYMKGDRSKASRSRLRIFIRSGARSPLSARWSIRTFVLTTPLPR